jgi:hypothetical protein
VLYEIPFLLTGMQDNPMYVSAGPRGQAAGGSSGAGAVYSTVDKKKHVPDSNKNDVYAEVDKSKKSKECNNILIMIILLFNLYK